MSWTCFRRSSCTICLLAPVARITPLPSASIACDHLREFSEISDWGSSEDECWLNWPPRINCAKLQIVRRIDWVKMSELVEYRMHQQIAQEIYRQQMMQRLPGNYKDPIKRNAVRYSSRNLSSNRYRSLFPRCTCIPSHISWASKEINWRFLYENNIIIIDSQMPNRREITWLSKPLLHSIIDIKDRRRRSHRQRLLKRIFSNLRSIKLVNFYFKFPSKFRVNFLAIRFTRHLWAIKTRLRCYIEETTFNFIAVERESV